MSFVKRQIKLVIQLGQGTFEGDKGDTLTLTGLRMQVTKNTYGHESMGSVQVRVWGLPLHVINKLTTIGPINNTIRAQNKIFVSAGIEGAALANIFTGVIYQAWGEFNAAPDVVFNIAAMAGVDASLKPIAPSTFDGSADVAEIMAGLAATMGYAFENNNVSVILSNPYLPGTALEQVRSCARAANINYLIENDVLSIWPARGVRKGDVPVISPYTGLVGYPTFTANGVNLTTLFTPNAVLGGKVKIDSQLTPANGEWPVTAVTHELECNAPNGKWYTHLETRRVSV